MRVHLVYPHGNKISTPDAIGRNLAIYLSRKYPVLLYEWNKPFEMEPEQGDVLIGHPHPDRHTSFRMNMTKSEWLKKIVLCPYAHGDYGQIAYLDDVIRKCDKYLAITGNYWYEENPKTIFSHWMPKMKRMDLAVDRKDFPFLKRKINETGHRKMVYIGEDKRYKNMDYLREIARLATGIKFYWIGNKKGGNKDTNIESLGFMDFKADEAKRILSEMDFMITVGDSDANPTTILEAMSWGLIPICTPQSGYYGYKGILNIPLCNANEAARILEAINAQKENELLIIQKLNEEILENHFNWERFCKEVACAIETKEKIEMAAVNWKTKNRILWARIMAPYWKMVIINKIRNFIGRCVRKTGKEALFKKYIHRYMGRSR